MRYYNIDYRISLRLESETKHSVWRTGNIDLMEQKGVREAPTREELVAGRARKGKLPKARAVQSSGKTSRLKSFKISTLPPIVRLQTRGQGMRSSVGSDVYNFSKDSPGPTPSETRVFVEDCGYVCLLERLNISFFGRVTQILLGGCFVS